MMLEYKVVFQTIFKRNIRNIECNTLVIQSHHLVLNKNQSFQINS